jgi:predicted nucleic acid-binding protein
MVIAGLMGKTVYLDTAPLIYFIEGNNQFHSKLLPLFTANAANELGFITSTITLLEVLVKPLGDGDLLIAQQYRDILTNSPTLQLISIGPAISEEAARLRAQYNLRTPDSIQLAAAKIGNADIFLTNNADLKRVAGPQIVTLMELF